MASAWVPCVVSGPVAAGGRGRAPARCADRLADGGRGTIGGVQFGPRSTVRIARQELEQLLMGAPIATAGEAASGVPSPRSRGLEVET